MKSFYRRYQELIVIKPYGSYTNLKVDIAIAFETRGLLIDSATFILGATPDKKVVFDGKFGNMEFKYVLLLKTFFVVYIDVTHKICINKIKDN